MAQIFGFDEIEKIRSLPYEQFFGEMGITKEQKQKRIKFSEKLEDDMRFLLLLTLLMYESGKVEAKKAANQFESRILSWISNFITLDSETKTYISELCLSITETTIAHISEKYYVSEDRVRLVSENAASDCLNHDDFKQALKTKKYKTWNTIIDGRERSSHHKENQIRIPIENYFLVGNALMRYPHDMAVAFTNPEEVINCRCWVTYS